MKELIIIDTNALETQNYLEERAARGSKEKFLSVLDKVPAEK